MADSGEATGILPVDGGVPASNRGQAGSLSLQDALY
jgi:hypothetical protein